MPVRAHHPERRRALSRRQLLAALGAGGASLLAPSIFGRSPTARAQTTQRLVLFYTAHGCPAEQWKMPLGNAETSDFQYDLTGLDVSDFSRALSPLHRHRSQLAVVSGLSELSHMEDEVLQGRARHAMSSSSIFSAAGRVNDSSGGASLDQLVAAQVAVPGRFASLELGDGPSPSYVSAGNQLTAESRADRAFDRLFPTGTEPMEMPTEETRIRDARSRVLGFVSDEYDRAATRLPADDRLKLEQHRDMLSDLARRVDALGSVSCSAPNAPADRGTIDDHFRLAAAALACDLTRVATVTSRQLNVAAFGGLGSDTHQDNAHHGGDAGRRDAMGRYYATHAEQLATFLDTLAAIPEGAGSMLDNTTCVWLTELATGDHALWDMMAVVVGGPLRKGQYVHYADRHDFDMGSRTYPVSRGHTELLRTVAHSMSVDGSSWAKPSVSDASGASYRLDGRLDELV